MKRVARGVLGLALIAALVPAPAGAQPATPAEAGSSLDEAALIGPPRGRALRGAELERATRALASRLRCPVCQGLPIADSPSASALAMLSQTRDLLARGYTEAQVEEYFVRAYGEFVLLQPTAEGFNLVVWLAPLAAVAIGGALIARRLRRARRRADRDDGDGGHGGGRGGGGGDKASSDGGDDPGLDRYLERVRSEVGP